MAFRRFRWTLGLVAAVALVGAACGDGSASDGGGGTTLTGDLFISGSSTVEPVTGLIAELFNEENPGVPIDVEGPGTGDGFELFCNGETDISDASRPIQEEEAQACSANGVEYVELEVAIDGMAVLTSPGNTAVTCLTFADLYALLGPESQGFENWSDANALAAEVGGTGGYPNARLDITAPGEESGTYDSFIELALEGIAEERGQEAVVRPDYQSSANDNVIIEGIAGAPASLGWVGYAFYEQNQDVVRAIEVDGGDGCVAPSPETIADGTYPLARSLFIYVNKDKAAEKTALTAFVDLYVTETGLVDSVQQVGYVPLPPERIEQTRSAWENGKP
ncbi:MAG: phosphate ABC transporter substrate-binding protein PstS family protein [Actinomycetota bacterium]